MVDTDTTEKCKWFALESNPDVMTAYSERLGLDSTNVSFYDVLSTDDWALEMIPRPVYAVLMLFPVKNITENHRSEEYNRIIKEGQIVSENVYYMKQTVPNACGTVGLLHALANARNLLQIKENSYLTKFLEHTANMSPLDIAEYLSRDEELESTHESAAVEGQSAPDQSDVDTHFVCFSHVEGFLYELDGRKEFPINHGPSSADTLLEDAVKVVKDFMSRDPEEMRFTIVALASK